MNASKTLGFLGLSAVGLLGLGAALLTGDQGRHEAKTVESALFRVNLEKQEITGTSDAPQNLLKLGWVAVSTDQGVYWPQEDVFLKVLMPLAPSAKVNVTVSRKDAAPSPRGPYTLNEAGLLVETILSGKERRLEAGEYRVRVASADGSVDATAVFSVVEGSLGAL
ncbi:MAG: hypothetical protein J0L75_15885, partial [Spirochaetes bacterium]|nr:hypothetical protein [Spirochaetota bacterium]